MNMKTSGTTDIETLLKRAAALSVEILLQDDQLVIEMDEDEDVDDDFLDALRNNKDTLLQYLKVNNPPGSTAQEHKLQRIPEGEKIPLSFSQERLWLVDKLEGSLHYHIPSVVHMKGRLDRNSMEAALRDIVHRHEALRTVIRWSSDDDAAWQHTLDAAAWQLRDITTAETDAFVQKPFDLSADYMLRAALITVSPEEHTLVIVTHHIASDGWSESIIVSELAEQYAARIEKRTSRLHPLPFRYADYAAWQRNHITGKVLANQLGYWEKQLSGLTALELPLDYARPAVQSTRGALAAFNLNTTLTAALKQFSQNNGATLFMTLLAAFKILLQRYSKQEDICVGIPVAGRKLRETEPIVGYFINTLAIRSHVENALSFSAFLQQLKETLLQAYQHQDTPFEKMMDAVVTERDLGRTPLFQVMFSLQNTPETAEVKLGDMVLSTGNTAHNSAKFDLSFVLEENPSGLTLDIEYCTDLFLEDTIARMAGHYEQLLESLIEDPEQPLAALNILTAAEQHRLLEEFSSSPLQLPAQAPTTLVSLFSKQALLHADETALVGGGITLSYRELDERSNQVAHFLQSRGVKTESLVAVCMDRSPLLVICMLGILKAGAAYVPLDAGYPRERIAFMLADSGSEMVLTTSKYASLCADAKGAVIPADENIFEHSSTASLKDDISDKQLAYVIYTSGSTGRPKGVMIEHRNVVNLVRWHTAYYEVSAASKATAMASIGFDAFGWELWPYLCAGAATWLLDDDTRLSPETVVSLYVLAGITHSFVATGLVPEIMQALQGQQAPLQYLLTGGDRLPSISLAGVNYRLVNNYGPTENTVVTSSYTLPASGSTQPAIGRAVSNTRIYITDASLRPVPVGVAGELCVSGDQLARGYLGQPELTAEKFVPHPFRKGERLYRTGDLARWLPDGNIEFLGRKDEQVKIRGYRIELGEIENVLLQSNLLSQAVVIAAPDLRGNKRLIAYIVPADVFNETALADYLKTRLPAYMIPALYVEMAAIPLTANGKVDRRALPVPQEEVQTESTEYALPRNATETTLAMIWKELLGTDKISIHDNFFRLGGDSIISIQLVSRARRAGYELQPKDVFLHQTIAQLAALAVHRGGALISAGEQGMLNGVAGLLPIQQWFFEEGPAAVSDLNHFNQSMLLRINRQLSSTQVSLAIQQLLQHHDALRFSYTKNETGWQQVYSEKRCQPVTIDLGTVPEEALAARISEYCGEAQQQLDITAGKLVNILHIITPETASHNRLFIAVHHLAIDGISWRILLEDLDLLLQGTEAGLAEKTSSYRQWYAALEQYSQTPALSAQQPYWEHVMKTARPLPVDHNEGQIALTKDTVSFSMHLDATLTRSLLHEAPQAYNTEINDILLAALALTLHEWAGYQQIAIGLEGHGRENLVPGVDTSHTTGWFTTLYPLLLDMTGAKEKDTLIINIKEQLRQLPDKGAGFGVLRYIRREPSLQGMLPWNILFNYLGQFDNISDEESLLTAADEYTGKEVSGNFPVRDLISINSMIQGGVLTFYWNYSSRHYEDSTAQSLAAIYIDHLQELIRHCVQQAKQEQIFTPADYGLSGEVSYGKMNRFLHNEEDPKAGRIASMYRLSPLQEGMLFHGLYDGHASAYIEQFTCQVFNTDPEILEQSWQRLLQKHTILRTAFEYEALEIPVQCVYNGIKAPFIIQDLRHPDSAMQQAAIGDFLQADKAKGIDFKTPPLMRIALLQTGARNYYMVWTYHHILLDGWSVSVLMEELMQYYQQLCAGSAVKDTETDAYEDYIRFISSQDKNAAEQHWRQYMNGISTGTLLPFVQAASGRNKGAGHFNEALLNLDEESSRQAAAFAGANGLTINTLVQGIWACLLRYYTRQDAVTYGVTVSGRPAQLPSVEKRVGMYINTLPLFTTLTDETNITAWLQQLQQEQLQCRDHGYLPLNTIQQWAGISGDLFDSILVFENYPQAKDAATAADEFRMDHVEIKEHSNYPLSLIVGAAERLQVLFIYNEAILEKAYVQQMTDHFRQLLLQIISSSYNTIGELNPVTEEEHRRLVYTFNQTSHPYPEHENIVSLFRGQVQQRPDATAVICGLQQITYRSLDEQSGKLAHYLRKKGVSTETLVPVCMERSLEMMVVIMAILKAGGAYVPIDPSYPWERIRFMLEDAGKRLIITDAAFRNNMKEELAMIPEIICTDELTALITAETALPEADVQPEQLAYIMYTSGSTGRPKGVMITHRNVVSLVCDPGYMDLTHEDAVLSAGSLSFDATTFEYWGMLLNGGRLVLSEENDLMDIAVLKKTLVEGGVNKLFMTTAWFNQLVDVDITVFEQLSGILVGGEKMSVQHAEKFHRHYPQIAFSNIYGPTENTTFSLSYLINDKPLPFNVPIGIPMSNCTAYVLDSKRQPVSPGVAGELYVGGAGVARGYFEQPELTAEKFISHPFSSDPLEKLYRTGDIARWLPDGNIEYITRMDDQVKVRGYRIELGEVEAALQQCPLVKQNVVLALADDNGQKKLVAWVVPQERFDREAILAFLREQVPAYMVPAALVEIAQLPLTANGKVDKKQLLLSGAGDAAVASYVAPRNKTEESLAAIWKHLLKREQVGIHDNFFESGGHSLLAIRLMAAIREETGKELSVRSLFLHPTIAALAAFLHGAGPRTKLPAITAAPRPQRIPLSYSQERLWFIDQLEGSLHYHMPSVLRLKGRLNREALEQSLRTIIARHEVLRTSIIAEDGVPCQLINGHEQWTLKNIAADKLEENIHAFISRPFDLSADYLLRAGIAIINEAETVLVLVMHHIASDGWSAGILVRELSTLYEQALNAAPLSLPALPLQYADYALWQRAHVNGDFLQSEQTYWTAQLSGVAPLQLQTDYERPLLQSNAGAIVHHHIDPLLKDKLQQFSAKKGVTLYTTLLAAYKVLLFRYSGQEDICVGTVAAGRQQQETAHLIGFFVNTLALRTEVKANMPFTSLLEQVKTTLLESYEHQYLPYEKVVELVVKDRDMSRSPLFQAMFVSEDVDDTLFHLADLAVSPGELEYAVSKFDLNFMCGVSEEGIDLNIVYCSDLFAAATVQRMARHFEQLLWSAVALPSQEVGALYMLAPEEEQELLHQFCRQSVHLGGGKKETIIGQLFGQVLKHPQATALVYEGKKLSYRELDKRAGILAQFLRKKGIRHDKLVPICMERSLEMIVGILGILKAGGAYVPIDPAFPEDRIAYILEDTGSRIVLADRHLQPKLQSANITTFVDLREDWQGISTFSETATTVDHSHPDQLAYVIYTSGSTGRPKGVMVEHRQLTDYLYGLHQRSGSEECRSFALIPTIATDLGNTVLFGALAAGAALHIISAERITDAELLHEYFLHNRIDCLKIVPSHWKALSAGDTLLLPEQLLIFGGEALQQDVIKMIQASGSSCMVYNHYGPTETTIGKCMYKAIAHRTGTGIPIGAPMAGAVAYITDRAGNLVPPGVGGELWIGGGGVARGYWNQPELTAEKFIRDPFSADAGARVYKTGDLARWLPDGNILFMGRIDDQVKIRGYRTEPGEIERVLQESGMVLQGIVMPRKDSTGNTYLAAYLVMKENFTVEQALNMLRNRLPEYMIPTAVMELQEIPLTANGKINRKALPEPVSASRSAASYAAPVTVTEQWLSKIWQELLDTAAGIHHNFFEAGGHSLAAVRLLSRIRKAGYNIRLNDLMTHKTIAAQASLLDGLANSGNTTVPMLPGGEHVVALGGKATDRPLFIIPGGDGLVDWYDGVAAGLEAAGPVYGISMPGLLDGEQPLNSVEELAAWNISRIRSIQPTGPYRLMGHSFGAYVLYEMIRQLEAVNEQVEQAVILDAPATRRVSYEEVDTLVNDALQYLEEYQLLEQPYPQWVQDLKDRLVALPADERRAFLLNAIHQKYIVLSGLPDLTQRTIRLLISNTSIGYTVAGAVKAPLLVVRAAEQNWLQLGFDERLGWEPFTAEVKTTVTPGDHASMIKNENALTLATTLNNFLTLKSRY